MTMMTPARFLRALKKTPHILESILEGISQERAEQSLDGDWNVVAVVCHLRDFEEIFFGRAQLMYEQENPQLPAYAHKAMAIERNYHRQNLREALDAYKSIRHQFVTWLELLTPEEWHRSGIHPENGQINILEAAMQAALHDVDHIEQILKALEEPH